MALPNEFHLERYFARFEFEAPYLLSCSDAEPLMLSELLSLADDECRSMWDNLKLSYTETRGNPLLRREVAAMYGASPDHTLMVVPQEGIYIATKCLVNYLKTRHGMDHISTVCTFPGYQSLYENTRSLGCDVRLWQASLDQKTGWTFNLDDLKSLVTSDTKLLVVNFPHNPTGFIPSQEQWKEIVDFCKSRDIFIFSDEMYRFTNNDGSEPLPAAFTVSDDAITLCGLSKTFALPGLRVGWLCTKNEEVMKMMMSLKDYVTICGSAPSEILAIIALRNREKIASRTLGIVRENLGVLDKFFGDYSDIFVWYRPKAGTTGFVKLKGWLSEGWPGGAGSFCEQLVQEAKVMLLPAKCFDFTDQYVRFGFAYKSLPEVLKHLEKFLENHKPK